MKPYNGFTPEDRNAAQAWLNIQWKAGTLPRPTKCCACGQEHGIIDAHAEDYSLPFEAGKTDQYHLCFRCHMMVHCRYKNRREWLMYKLAVSRGFRFPPFMTRNFGLFQAEMLTRKRRVECTQHEAPTVLALEQIEAYMADK